MSSLFNRNTSTQANPHAQDRPVQTAAEALAQIAGWPDLSATERRDLISAVNTVVRVAGVPADLLPLTPERLRATVLNKSAAGWGVSSEARSNVLWRLRKALRRLDLIDSPPEALGADWVALRELADSRTRMAMASFAAFCTSRTIVPAEVADQHLAQFEDWLAERTLNATPRRMVTAVRRAWNHAATNVPGWPKMQLNLPSRRGQLLLPFSAFPASFQQDVDSFAAKVTGQTMTDKFGVDDEYNETPGAVPQAEAASDMAFGVGGSKPALKPMRPLTVASKLQLIKVAANALHRSGQPLTSITSLTSLVMPLSSAAAILNTLEHEAAGAPSPKLGHVAELLRQLAKYHADSPAKDIAQLSRWAGKARVQYKEMTGKNRRLVEQVLNPARHQALLSLPDALLEDAAEQGLTKRGAKTAKHAALINLLVKCPMRLANLLGLRLDQHLLRPDPRKPEISAIMIGEEETKNRVPLLYPLSRRTAGILEIWLRDYRPLLATPGNRYVFPGKGLGPMTRAGMRDAVKAVTNERIGIAVNPHAFRHIAAEAFLQRRPGDYENTRRLLGHKRLETTTKSYCRSENKAAMALYDELLEGNRATLGVNRKRNRRKAQKPVPAQVKRRRAR